MRVTPRERSTNARKIMLVFVIAACEVAFWVLLAGGLSVRYVLHRSVAGAVLLACVPLVDVVLLVAGTLDLRAGGEPTFAHSLAAIFLGCSIAFGHQTIRWADRWAAYRLAGAARPVKPPKVGPAAARRARRQWYRHLLAWSIGVGLMLLGTLLVRSGDPPGLLGPSAVWTIVLVVDGVIAFSDSVRASRHSEPEPASGTLLRIGGRRCRSEYDPESMR
jgi:hypothetical protein